MSKALRRKGREGSNWEEDWEEDWEGSREMSRCCDARRLPAAAASEKCEKCASWLKRFQVEQSEVTCGKTNGTTKGSRRKKTEP